MIAIGFRRKYWVLAAFCGPVALAVLAILLLPPKYRAQSDILVKTGHEYLAQAEGEAGLTAPTSTKQEGINSEIALLTGRAVVEATIAAIGLGNLYPGLVENPPWWGTIEDAAVYKFHKDLLAEPIKLSNVIAVSFDGRSPEEARLVLDRLIRIFIDKHTQVFTAGQASSYAETVDRERAEVAMLEQQRTRLKRESSTYDIGAQRSALIAQRVAAQAHLLDVINSAATLTHRLDFLTHALPEIAGTLRSTSTDRDEADIHRRQTLTDLQTAEAAMAARFGNANPDLQRVRDQAAALRREAAGSARDRVNTAVAPSPLWQQVQTEIVMDRAQLAPLAAEQLRYEALVVSIDDEMQRLEQADLDLRTLGARIDALYGDLRIAQARYDQARTQEQMDLSRQVSVVQVAPSIAPNRAAKPNRLLLLAGGVLLGLLGAGATVVFSIVTANTLVTEDGVERLLGLPVLLSLPVASRKAGTVTLPLE